MTRKPSAAQMAAQLLDQYMERPILKQLLREDRERRQMEKLLIDQARYRGRTDAVAAFVDRLTKRKGDKHG